MLLFLACSLLPTTPLLAASADSILHEITKDTLSNNRFIVVQNIHIKGNKSTKNHIILRELDLKVGDTIKVKKLSAVLELNRNQIYNTRLFNEASIKVHAWKGNNVELLIEVTERWYIFPVPIFELTDRNFNVWWNEYNHDFSRTEYGLHFVHENFRGRKERLKAVVQFGFSKKFELKYNIPYIDKARKTGINPFISYILNKEIGYRTAENQILSYRHDKFAQKRFRMGMVVNRHPDNEIYHQVNFSFFKNSIADTLGLLNPSYFLEGRTTQKYLYLAYILTIDKRDIRAYPLNGNYFRLQMSKAGLGAFGDINMAWIIANYSQYFKIAHRFYGAANVRLKMSFPNRQPYFNQQGMGFGNNYVRGYERYIIDGQGYGLIRTSLRYNLLDVKAKIPFIKAGQFNSLPFAVYAKTYYEMGYVEDHFFADFSDLKNELLLGTGVGLDVVTAYDIILSFEYTYNRLKKAGFFMTIGFSYDM